MNKLTNNLHIAFDRFKKLVNGKKSKFKKLPFWLNYVSWQFEKEDKNKLPNYYYHFDRGSVIRVNFGVNPGSEFSFTHFAIVLDKHDNAKKSTLTVLPLTSKYNKNRYSLGKDVFNQTIAFLKKQNQQLTLRVNNDSEMIKALKYAPSNDSYNKQSELIHNDQTKIANDLKELDKVIDTYKEFNKNSYVRLTDITTISKLRIQKLNKFDPSGNIKLTSQQMKDISLQISKLFLDK